MSWKPTAAAPGELSTNQRPTVNSVTLWAMGISTHYSGTPAEIAAHINELADRKEEMGAALSKQSDRIVWTAEAAGLRTAADIVAHTTFTNGTVEEADDEA